MGNSFDVVGVAILSSSKRSLRLEIKDSQHNVFTEYFYVSVKDIEAVLNGRKKTATIYILKSENV